MKLIYDISISIITSIITVGSIHFFSRWRIKNIYNNIVGYYKEVDKDLKENFDKEIYELSFSMNFFKHSPIIRIKFISGKPDKADWETIFSVTPPSYYHLIGTYKYINNKTIEEFDFNDVGVHNIYIVPQENFILIEVNGKKYNYDTQSFMIKKIS